MRGRDRGRPLTGSYMKQAWDIALGLPFSDTVALPFGRCFWIKHSVLAVDRYHILHHVRCNIGHWWQPQLRCRQAHLPEGALNASGYAQNEHLGL